MELQRKPSSGFGQPGVVLHLTGREWATIQMLLLRSRYLADRVVSTGAHSTDGTPVLIQDLTTYIDALERAEENAK
ncbi:hypothetical protein Axy23_007 [Achromobacter phage vB_AxyP_19-32_Axy23]|uniref:Uncharacterized protein n=1 Tax=Achromobacter phage vB_AxyP_19-32_Axy23 TaxID=2591047 RepID=A0A514CW69_9CAUD|nr:hypothetical protein Axy23_007 [Achromobacter phage vB_AxyP_19-32_Axy23]